MSAQGTATLDFGAFPGSERATVDVTGQTGFIVTSLAEAFVYPKATADHTLDEHLVEELTVAAAYQADGTIRIYGQWEPRNGPLVRSPNAQQLYGQFNVGWVWS